MSQDYQPAQPGPEHEKLAENAGGWNVECTYFMGPEPMKVTATETVEMVGGFWTLSLFEANFMGMPFRGRCTVGYDQHSAQWVSTWIDSMSSHLFVLRGGYQGETGKTLELSGPGPHPGTQKMTSYRTTETSITKDRREFEMFVKNDDGSEHKMFHYVYTRA